MWTQIKVVSYICSADIIPVSKVVKQMKNSKLTQQVNEKDYRKFVFLWMSKLYTVDSTNPTQIKRHSCLFSHCCWKTFDISFYHSVEIVILKWYLGDNYILLFYQYFEEVLTLTRYKLNDSSKLKVLKWSRIMIVWLQYVLIWKDIYICQKMALVWS